LPSPVNDEYDLIVIGAGSAGLTAARFGARVGATVLLVERDRVGGDCTWTGCIPSKTLLHAAKVAHLIRGAEMFGISAAEVRVDFPRVMGQVKAVIDQVYRFESPGRLEAEGIGLLKGEARFVDKNTIDVSGRRVKANRFVIATGADPVLPPIQGLAETPYLTYETVFDLAALPTHLLVLGAGPVGIELAQAFLRLGSRVTVLEEEDRILPIADPEAVEVLARGLVAEGMQIKTGYRMHRLLSSAARVVASSAGTNVEGDALLVAVGRKPRLDRLDLQRIGVEVNGKPARIKVDDHLRTTAPTIYAAGDVTGSFQFTHYAGFQGFQAARNALLPGVSKGVQATVPWVVFTDPEVGQVGVTEAEARRRSDRVRVHRWPMARVDRAQTQAATEGFIKIVTEPDGTVLGATIVASLADPMVNELAVAMAGGIKLSRLASTIHAYPTYGFGIQQLAAEDALTKATSGLKGKLLRGLAR